MPLQNRIYVTLSPRMRKALELCAALDGSTPASYAAFVLSSAITQEIEQHPALNERWLELEREALLNGSWDDIALPGIVKREATSHRLNGWILAGSHPSDYESGSDEDEIYDGKPSGYIRARADEPAGFGTLMQTFKADDYRGKRLRYTAQVKSVDVATWAGLWMRIDGPQHGQPLGFYNMQEHPIQGTTDWHLREIVLDVPQESTNIAFGLLLSGPGQVWINAVQFAEVGKEAPLTTTEMPTRPVNLDFGRDPA